MINVKAFLSFLDAEEKWVDCMIAASNRTANEVSRIAYESKKELFQELREWITRQQKNSQGDGI